jgi:hypothetical protein
MRAATWEPGAGLRAPRECCRWVEQPQGADDAGVNLIVCSPAKTRL